MKVNLMTKYEDGRTTRYKTYEASAIIEAEEDYLLILKPPIKGEQIEEVSKDLFYLEVETEEEN